MESSDSTQWRKCSSCKKPIAFGSPYYVCSVSTCTNARTGYVFCSVGCFEVHLPTARHRDAAAIESHAPAREPSRTVIKPPKASSPAMATPREVLVIASRLKEYIQARAQMNTSAQVMDVLSDFLRIITDRAIDNARADGRKTLLDRDFDFLKKPV